MSLLRWVGGKSRLLPEILPRLPAKYDRWIEPFFGSGAAFFAVKPERAIVGDNCQPLMDFYAELRRIPGLLHARVRYDVVWGTTSYAYYRHAFNCGDDSADTMAALFWYLNRTCWNGLWRTNKKGEFNVPVGSFGARGPTLCSLEEAQEAARALVGVELGGGGWGWARSTACAGDFVYLDPPYWGTKGAYDGGFSQIDQENLADACHAFDRKGVLFLAHNADISAVHSAYRGFKIERVTRQGTVSSRPDRRQRVGEVIIRNY